MTLTIGSDTADWRLTDQARARAAGMCPGCYGTAPVDGDCRYCAAHYDPDAQAYGSAQARLDDGEYTTQEERRELERIVAAYERAEQIAELEAGRAPNSCRHCGIVDGRSHPQTWIQGPGWHTWTAPSNAHRLLRMKARRALRDGRLYLIVGQEFRRILAEAERGASRG